MKPSINMEAVLILTQHRSIGQVLIPHLNIPADSIKWDNTGYHGQSGGVQIALSWAYCLFCDEMPPAELNYRDPFSGFGSLDRDVQSLILEAQAVRHGFTKFSLEDKPKSYMQKMLEDIAVQEAEDERRSNLKVLKKDK